MKTSPDKKSSGMSFEERVEQDVRLTGKHIKTLLHMQELHAENEHLKAHVAQLELFEAKDKRCDLLERELDHQKRELLKCKEIHDIAKESKEKLQQMQKDCLARIDESNRQFTEKHKQEMMRLVSEKLEEENNWAIEKNKLVEQIEQLQKETKTLKEQVDHLKNGQGEIGTLTVQLQEANASIEFLKKKNQLLDGAKLALQKGIGELTCENDSLRTALAALNTKTKVLEVQARQAREETAKKPQDLTSEVNELKEKISKLENENSQLQEEIQTKDKVIDTLEFDLQDSTQTLKHLYKERDLLKNRITGLLNEIAALKSQPPEPRQTFSDFVRLKRDFTTLRDEHEKLLKKRGSKPNILPCLTADSKTVARTYSCGSIRSKTSSSS